MAIISLPPNRNVNKRTHNIKFLCVPFGVVGYLCHVIPLGSYYIKRSNNI